MLILFCASPLDPRAPDPDYWAEAQAASVPGIPYALVDDEALRRGNLQRAIRLVTPAEHPQLALYRGWMLRPADYAQLWGVLREHNIHLINPPQAYLHCHYLPEWYPNLAAYTPASVWLPLDGQRSTTEIMAEIMTLLRPFGSKPLILKDYVKSRKHEWFDACYIPDASDPTGVARIVTRFLERQGADLNEGLVFREFVPLAPLGNHPKSGMPLTREYRLFCLDGQILMVLPSWDGVVDAGPPPPLETFQSLIKTIPSRFFTMDIAQRHDGTWLVVEVGDGQVSGLPDHANLLAFYDALAHHLTSD